MQLTLSEYDTAQAVALTAQQRDQLRSLTASVTVVPTIGHEGRYDLTPGSSVGVIHLAPDLELLIRPSCPSSASCSSSPTLSTTDARMSRRLV